MKIRLGLLLMIVLGSSRGIAEEVAGMVINVSGAVTLEANGSSVTPTMFSRIAPRTRIVVAAGGELSVTHYGSKSIYKLSGPAQAVIDADAVQSLGGNAPEVTPLGEKLAAAANRSQTMTAASYRMRKLDMAIIPLEPASRTLALGDALSFSWRSLVPGPFEVTLRRLDGATPVFSASTATESVSLPTELLPLAPGKYEWSVSVGNAEGGSAKASDRFQIAEAELAAQLQAIRPANGASPEEWALYGKIAQSMGFLQEAKSVWRELAAKHPSFQHLPVN